MMRVRSPMLKTGTVENAHQTEQLSGTPNPQKAVPWYFGQDLEMER